MGSGDNEPGGGEEGKRKVQACSWEETPAQELLRVEVLGAVLGEHLNRTITSFLGGSFQEFLFIGPFTLPPGYKSQLSFLYWGPSSIYPPSGNSLDLCCNLEQSLPCCFVVCFCFVLFGFVLFLTSGQSKSLSFFKQVLK